jgi:uncharacterized protein (DUF2062 family)
MAHNRIGSFTIGDRSFRSLLRQILHLQESPHRTALAFAVGVFIAFCPLYGLHTVLVVLCTWLLGLNFLALFAGAFVNNPWTIVPIFGVTYWTGALLLGMDETPPFNWHDLSMANFYEQILPYAVPFALGGLVLSLLGALLAYPAAYFFITKHRRSAASPALGPLPPRE